MKNGPLFLFCFICFLSCSNRQEAADLILFNGKILTLDTNKPEVTAIAISGDRILALGSNEEINAYKNDQTRSIDLKGQLAIPGLIEGHGHYMSLGRTLMQLDLSHAKSWDEIVQLVELAVKDAEPGDWILGWGWHQDKWGKSAFPVT